MPAEDQAEIELLASQLDAVEICVKLKVEGLSEKQMKTMAPFFAVEFHPANGDRSWWIQSAKREFGTHKIQTVQLFAVALLIHSHFPDIKMALMNSTEIASTAPMMISDASQIFLQQAGFELQFEKTHRALTASEMALLKNQLQQMHPNQQLRKGA